MTSSVLLMVTSPIHVVALVLLFYQNAEEKSSACDKFVIQFTTDPLRTIVGE